MERINYHYINNVQWFTSLKEEKGGLLARHKNIEKHNVVLCLSSSKHPKNNGEPSKLFAWFTDYIAVFDYLEIYTDEHCFFEVLTGTHIQKPHFDIDISYDEIKKFGDLTDINPKLFGIQILKYLQKAINNILEQHGVKLDVDKNILIYSAHGPNKRSYHLVIKNYYHNSNKEARAFYDKVMTEYEKLITNSNFNKFIDFAVYKRNQQFRLLGSSKPGANRPKILDAEFEYYDGTIHKHIYEECIHNDKMMRMTNLCESLVGYCNNDDVLPSFAEEKVKKIYEQYGDLDDVILNQCQVLVNDKFGHDIFKIRESGIHGYFIPLDRLTPSDCEVCKVQHEKENPFMFIQNKMLKYNCGRSETHIGKKIYINLGNIDIKDKLEHGDVVHEDLPDEEHEEEECQFETIKYIKMLKKERFNDKETYENILKAAIKSAPNLDDPGIEEDYLDYLHVIFKSRQNDYKERKLAQIITEISFRSQTSKFDIDYLKSMARQDRPDLFRNEPVIPSSNMQYLITDNYYYSDFIDEFNEKTFEYSYKDDKFNSMFQCKQHIFNTIITPKACRVVRHVHQTDQVYFKISKDIPFKTIPIQKAYNYKFYSVCIIYKDREGEITCKSYSLMNVLMGNVQLESNRIVCKPFHFHNIPTNLNGPRSDEFNIFPGFKAKFIENLTSDNIKTIEPILLHIFNIWADKNADHYFYILNWLAKPLRHLVKTCTGLLVHGDQGAGKTIISTLISECIYGKDLSCDVALEDITGVYNTAINNKILITVAEGQCISTTANAKQMFTRLKGNITDSTIMIHTKYIPIYPIDNVGNYLIFSNFIYPILLEKSDRRWASFFTATWHLDKGDQFKREYFEPLIALCTGHNKQFVADILYTVLIRGPDLGIFPEMDISVLPDTESRAALLEYAKPPAEQFIDGIISGEITFKSDDIIVNPTHGACIQNDTLYNLFSMWVNVNKVTQYPRSNKVFTSEVNKIFEGMNRKIMDISYKFEHVSIRKTKVLRCRKIFGALGDKITCVYTSPVFSFAMTINEYTAIYANAMGSVGGDFLDRLNKTIYEKYVHSVNNDYKELKKWSTNYTNIKLQDTQNTSMESISQQFQKYSY